ncbi:cytochrome b/b6 domain-containing protein [Hyphococcus luteus]|uniref:Cytochrome B n=1 Tax=Hyphococcus luteus TaxID=2058213 RepID=A0A2S7K5E3_9PROT|nr:cytochrome b/b6 domain-containing protein [Marinicaulis flavus]PQA87727.1 cytochrome B [Marinicaulis flavus]
MAEMTPVRVWDAPTRIFHWLLVVLIGVCWFTGEEEGLATLVHRLSGEAIIGLLVFRFLWGFQGGEYARFSTFFAPPREIFAHIKELMRFRASQTLGHNSLGALASIVLMLIVALTAVSGLLSADDDRTGPLSLIFNVNLKELHEVSFRLLQAMVVVHLLGVAVTSFASRENLARAMVTGAKKRPADSGARDAKPGSSRALIAAAGAALLTAGGLMLLPHPPQETEHGEEHDDH